MDERMFDGERDPVIADSLATARSADLVEQLLDELTWPAHDWARIRGQASEIARIADEMCSRLDR